MATTIQKISEMLTAKGLKHEIRRSNGNEIILSMTMKTYRDPEGRDSLLLVVGLIEDGEYFRLFAPSAYKAEGPHKALFLQACLACQWRTKLIQFEFDASDGEIRPIIEFPLEDAELTSKQLHRCISGICYLLDTYHPTFKKALETGEIEMPETSGSATPVLSLEQQAAALLQRLLVSGRPRNDPLVRELQDLLEAGLSESPQAPEAF